ncbi:MAG: RecQ family ATP-dependent DNA helicase [Candidatus Sumerlaeota bacterium]|nr:RecQ family ATP-dependent DNA helicase [Candidatus Sumerlaeota bacterium]
MKDRALTYLRAALDRRDAEFRPGQWECVEGVLRNERQLVVQKTGWGKSMVYFIGARLLRDQGRGPALLVSPLLSLMRNQIDAARRIGIRAETINSSNQDQWNAVKERLARNEVDVLMISPERLANDDFRANVLPQVANRLGLFVVDEAHCISDWGHDFRPDYRRIVHVLRALPPNIPVLATTATANQRVTRDVAAQLGDLRVVRGPLIRETLFLQNIQLPGQAERLAWLARHLPRFPGTGIVYTLTIRDAERVADWLRRNGIAAEAYHSEVADFEERKSRRAQLERMLLENRIKALVATVALGMGFDKPDLGFVIHFQRPASVVHYYQQVGRAGRATERAFGVLLSGEEDAEIAEYFIRTAFPPQAHVDRVLGALNEARNGLFVSMLERKINLGRGALEKTLRFLSTETPSPVAKIDGRWHATPVDYAMDHERIQRLCELRRAEQREMDEYTRTRECLMLFLARALDDPYSRPCGKCANCLGRVIVSSAFDEGRSNQAAIFVRRSFVRIAPRKRWPTGVFEVYPFRGGIGPDLTAEEGRALSLWGDAGWGRLVRDAKYGVGRFPDELVEACLQLMEVWKPEPRPAWVACIPSLTHPNLVPDFARRFAQRLGLPFAPCLRKTRPNDEQKRMLNSFQQARNLDGVFEADTRAMPQGPALLVDDMVDSRWTFTVAAAILRQAGCPAVFPLALALNSMHGE